MEPILTALDALAKRFRGEYVHAEVGIPQIRQAFEDLLARQQSCPVPPAPVVVTPSDMVPKDQYVSALTQRDTLIELNLQKELAIQAAMGHLLRGEAHAAYEVLDKSGLNA